jgi:catechol 2,3-dioxygenase-like lactoylglutathione lyase family enzyme
MFLKHRGVILIVQIGELSFKTKKAAKAFFKDMLGRHNDYETVNDNDTAHLYNLIERHPEALDKIGRGIVRFFKAPTDQGTSCFWLEREDTSTRDFSYSTCVDCKGESLYQKFAEACRASVKEDLHNAKIKHFENHSDSNNTVPCDITGERIEWSGAHLDHKKPMTFQVIVRTFLAAQNISISPDMLSP